MKNFLLAGLGGALGSMARYAVALASVAMAGAGFPMGTLAVNVMGSFLIGMSLVAGWEPGNPNRLFLVTGVLGGFTTFSAFSGETLMLILSGSAVRALLNSGANLFLGLVAAALGLLLGRTALG